MTTAKHIVWPDSVPRYSPDEIAGRSLYDLIDRVFHPAYRVTQNPAYETLARAAKRCTGLTIMGDIDSLSRMFGPHVVAWVWCTAMDDLGYTEIYDV